MAGAVSKIIYENLCENEGCLEFGKCKEVLRNRRITVDHSVLLKTVSDNGKFAVSLAKDINSGTLVVAKTQLRVCQKVQGECLQCNHLHLCRYFICGNCKYGNKCKYSHDLASTHNLAILIEAGLNNLTGKELFPLLLQNDAYLLPEICSHYNRGPGQHGICKFPNSCIHLHVCQHFLQGDCKFGEKCRREHSFNDQVLKILKGRGLSDDKEILGKLYRCKSIIKQPPPNLENLLAHPEVTENLSIRSLRKRSTTSDTSAAPPTSEADRNEICLYFLRRQCRFKDKCSQVHYQLPYRWQVVQDSISWIDMPNMEETERAYCDPNNAFKHLGGTVQRLSTVSSVSKPHDLTLTTDWLWFWEDDDGSWVEYGMDKVRGRRPSAEDNHSANIQYNSTTLSVILLKQVVGEAGGITASVNSGTLERVYLSEKEMDCFSAGGCNYIIDFKEMRQQKVKSGAQREVRRRPRFVSTQEVQDKLRG